MSGDWLLAGQIIDSKRLPAGVLVKCKLERHKVISPGDLEGPNCYMNGGRYSTREEGGS